MSAPDWIEVFASPNPAQIAAVRSAFETERLTFSVKGELTMAMRGCVMPARVLVAKGQEARARALLHNVTAAMGC